MRITLSLWQDTREDNQISREKEGQKGAEDTKPKD